MQSNPALPLLEISTRSSADNADITPAAASVRREFSLVTNRDHAGPRSGTGKAILRGRGRQATPRRSARERRSVRRFGLGLRHTQLRLRSRGGKSLAHCWTTSLRDHERVSFRPPWELPFSSLSAGRAGEGGLKPPGKKRNRHIGLMGCPSGGFRDAGLPSEGHQVRGSGSRRCR